MCKHDKDEHEAFLREAIRLSIEKMHQREGGPFGAVIVKDGRVVGVGWNRVTSTNDPTAHAEIVAIREACRNLGTFSLAGATIYASCEPCPMCLAAVYWARLDALYYGATRADAAAAGFDDHVFHELVPMTAADRAMPTVQLLREEARVAFTQWLAKEDRIGY